jgi:glycosyltransferase involved in cell wall biosynthesis
MKTIQFLIANYNSIDHIDILIKSLRTNHPGVSYELLVADQGSTDGSKEYLESLPEVKLWPLEDRPHNHKFHVATQQYINQLDLTDYMHPFFIQRTLEADNRKFHGEAMNFLVSKATSPLCATLDTDMEFLGPYWFDAFLKGILQGAAAVGTIQDEESFTINNFKATVQRRFHPCLTVYRTPILQSIAYDFNFDPYFDLRMPLIHKSIAEQLPISIHLGDMGYHIFQDIKSPILGLDDNEFYGSVRHFNGATVKKDRKDELFLDWLNSIKHIKDLYKYAVQTYYYTSLNEEALVYCKKYWDQFDPPLPTMPKIPIIKI